MAEIRTWNTAAASNTQAPPHGCPEGWNPNQVNDWGRETMAAIRRWYDDAQWIDYGHSAAYVSSILLDVPGDKTDVYQVNRRVRAKVGTGTYFGYISASVYQNPNTRVTVEWDSGQLDPSLSSLSVGIISAVNTALPRSTTAPTILNGGDHFVSSIGAARLSANVITANSMIAVSATILAGTASAMVIGGSTMDASIINQSSLSACHLVNCVIDGGTQSGVVIANATFVNCNATGGSYPGTATNVDGITLSGNTLVSSLIQAPVIRNGTTTAQAIYNAEIYSPNIHGGSLSGCHLVNALIEGATISDASLYRAAFKTTVSGTARFMTTYVNNRSIDPTYCYAEKTNGVNQTIADIATETQVTFDKVRTPIQGFGPDLATATSRYTPNQMGVYLCHAAVRFRSDNITDGEELSVRIRRNGITSSQGRIRAVLPGGSSAAAQCVQVTSLEFMNGTTDYIDVSVQCMNGQSGQRVIEGLEGQTFLCVTKC